MSIDFAKSFLYLGGIHKPQSTEFALALSKVVEFMSAHKIPTSLLPPYHEFFASFIPTEDHSVSALKNLLALAIFIDADMKWAAHLQVPLAVLVDSAFFERDEHQTEVDHASCCHKVDRSAFSFKHS